MTSTGADRWALLDQPYMTAPQGQQFYGIGRNQLYNGIRRGDIPSVRIGRRILIPTALVRKQLGVTALDEAAA